MIHINIGAKVPKNIILWMEKLFILTMRKYRNAKIFDNSQG